MTALAPADERSSAAPPRTRSLPPVTPLTAAWPTLIVLGTLAACVPWLAEVQHLEQIVLLVVDLALMSASVAIGVTRGFRPMIALSAAFVTTWITVPSLFQLSHHLAAWGDDAVVGLRGPVTTALALCAVAQCCLLIGYVVALRITPPARAVPAPPKDRSLPLAALLVVVSLAALPLVARTVGGVAVLFSSRSGITDAAADAGISLSESGGAAIALLRVVPMSLAVAGTLLGIQYLRRDVRPVWSRWAAVSTVVVGAAMVITYANPLANSRFTALSALGAVVLLLLRPRRTAAGLLGVAAFVAFMLFAYPLANVFRGDGASTLDDVQPAGGTFAYLASRDYDGFQQIVNAVLFVQERGHTYGHYLLSAVLVFVPRAVWDGKATPASLDVAAARGYSFTDLSLPTNAELFIDFGWIGVVLVFLLLGAAYAWLDRQWLAGDRFGALVAFAALAQIGIIRGPLGSIVPVVDITLLVLVLEAVVTRRGRQGRSPHGTR